MDSNYIIKRLKGARYKYETVEILRTRINNLDPDAKQQIVANLKMELYRVCNADIFDPLADLLYRKTLAA